MGQDVAEYGGVFKVTEGFVAEFGKERVRNTPLCESAIIGTGLGLSICHSIIERHGGSIWFETETDKGTTFKVRIPLKAEIDEREEAVQHVA